MDKQLNRPKHKNNSDNKPKAVHITDSQLSNDYYNSSKSSSPEEEYANFYKIVNAINEFKHDKKTQPSAEVKLEKNIEPALQSKAKQHLDSPVEKHAQPQSEQSNYHDLPDKAALQPVRFLDSYIEPYYLSDSYKQQDSSISDNEPLKQEQVIAQQDGCDGDEHEFYMRQAYELALEAGCDNEVPVGAIIVSPNGEVIGRGRNSMISNNDPTAHAEIMAIRNAAEHVGNYRLIDCTMYVTLEPCCMCTGAAVHARLKNIVFGAYDEKTGACNSRFKLLTDERHYHKVNYLGGVLQEQCAKVLSDFFARRRKEKKQARLNSSLGS